MSRPMRHALCSLASLLVAAAAHAQPTSLSRVSVDSVLAADLFRGEGTTGNPDASVDVSSVFRVGGGWSVHVRPWFFRSSADNATWSRELYQAAVRYERAGRVGLRLDAGYIASPFGLGMLDMRADINPTIQPHLSYFVPLLRFDRSAPSVNALSASYPPGAVLTAATRRWDARVGVLGATPTRRYAFNSSNPNPGRTPTLVFGGGVTPRTGLRLGASLGRGPYAASSELSQSAGGRDLTLWTVEADYAVAYTRVAAEYTHQQFAWLGRRDASTTWFVQGAQTLSPRWMTAARHEVIRTPSSTPTGAAGAHYTFRTSEGALGYRLTPDLTLRTSVVAQRWFLAPKADRRVGVQLVWSRRWW